MKSICCLFVLAFVGCVAAPEDPPQTEERGSWYTDHCLAPDTGEWCGEGGYKDYPVSVYVGVRLCCDSHPPKPDLEIVLLEELSSTQEFAE